MTVRELRAALFEIMDQDREIDLKELEEIFADSKETRAAAKIVARYCDCDYRLAKRMLNPEIVRVGYTNEDGQFESDMFWAQVVTTDGGKAVEIFKNGFIANRIYSSTL